MRARAASSQISLRSVRELAGRRPRRGLRPPRRPRPLPPRPRSRPWPELGERAAWHAGLEVERVKREAGLFSALAVGAGTAVAGPIGFVGLVAPHIARIGVGPSHRLVAPAAALIGAALLLGADLGVRLIVPPAEPPVGLATSLIGGPFFFWLLLSRMRRDA